MSTLYWTAYGRTGQILVKPDGVIEQDSRQEYVNSHNLLEFSLSKYIGNDTLYKGQFIKSGWSELGYPYRLGVIFFPGEECHFVLCDTQVNDPTRCFFIVDNHNALQLFGCERLSGGVEKPNTPIFCFPHLFDMLTIFNGGYFWRNFYGSNIVSYYIVVNEAVEAFKKALLSSKNSALDKVIEPDFK